MHDHTGVLWVGGFGVFIHELREQGLIKRTPIDANANRFSEPHCSFDHGRKIAILFFPKADVAWIDAVLVQCLGASGVLLQQTMAVVMEIPDERYALSHAEE